MGKKKTVDFDPRKLSPQEKLKFEIAQELGLDSPSSVEVLGIFWSFKSSPLLYSL